MIRRQGWPLGMMIRFDPAEANDTLEHGVGTLKGVIG